MKTLVKPQWQRACVEIIVMVFAVIFLKKAFDPFFWRFSDPAAFFAVILAGIFFGYLHFYNQGYRGFITASLIGVAFGAMFLMFKRNLWPLIFVHGCIDTLGFTVRMLDLDV